MIETVTSNKISEYYSENVTTRYQSIFLRFQEKYKCKPDYVARAPGRVNIIGGHIDYEGYGVLPAAIVKDCLIAFKRVKSETIQITHCMPEYFPDCVISKYPTKVWDNIQFPYVKYFAAGYRAGVLDLINQQKIAGLQILIQGNIQWASGISSSSAFCVCSALVGHYANRVKKISQQQFIQRCIKFQRQVGTASGGMDQSISCLGKKGTCLYIQFNPIRNQRVEVPLDKYKLMIINSLVQSPKMQTAVYRYNKRVCECRIGTHLLSKKLGIQKQIYHKWKVLKQVQQYLNLDLKQMVILVEKHIIRKKYTKKQLQQQLGVQLLAITSDIQRAAQVLQVNKQFKMYEAIYHVYSEANRVLQFIQACKSDKIIEEKVKILGDILNKSQDSCRDLYQCSCPEIQQIIQIAKKNGALGSRHTGAGWGGCIVSLIPQQIEGPFTEAIIKQYFNKPGMLQKATLGINNSIFSTSPSEGAFVIDLLL